MVLAGSCRFRGRLKRLAVGCWWCFLSLFGILLMFVLLCVGTGCSIPLVVPVSWSCCGDGIVDGRVWLWTCLCPFPFSEDRTQMCRCCPLLVARLVAVAVVSSVVSFWLFEWLCLCCVAAVVHPLGLLSSVDPAAEG